MRAGDSGRRRSSRRVRILIVDDEPAVLGVVERLLREDGYDTTTASGGAEALTTAAEQGRFDLLVTDVMMPGMRGNELAARLRYGNPDLPVLYLTGFTDDLFKEKINLWQNEAYLDKPFSVKGLLEAVSMILAARISPPPIWRSYLARVRAFITRSEGSS